MTAGLTDLMASWLPQQRWYGGKGRTISSVQVERETSIGGTAAVHTLLHVTTEDGHQDRYQVLVGWGEHPVPSRLEHAVIGEVDGKSVYDALADIETTGALLALMTDNARLEGLEFHSSADLHPTGASRVLGGEQSNTSVVYGDDYILKLFRRLQPGINPDLEITRALTDAGSTHIPATLGWIEGDVEGQRTTLGMLQSYIRSASDGWAMATASVRDLFAEGDLHADEVGGDFAGEAERLGVATAEVHLLMADTLPAGTAGPAECRAAASQLRHRLAAAVDVVGELAPYVTAIQTAYDAVGARTAPVPVQRVHGDFHLGQVMRTQDGWVLLDFEGEPARSLAERTALMSPLRDVAGMLRSFDYAARHLLAERGGEPQLTYRANEWATRNRGAFCDGYARAAGTDPREEALLLRAFELDKAVYEVVYEARMRPAWLPIPLASIERLVAGGAGEGMAR